jgi:hypothetical protein
MKKKPTRKTKTDVKVSMTEMAKQRELQTLHRINRLHQRIVAVSRDVRRSVRRADVARLDAARELCADTGFGVFGISEVDTMQRQVEALRAANSTLMGEVAELRSELALLAPDTELSATGR